MLSRYRPLRWSAPVSPPRRFTGTGYLLWLMGRHWPIVVSGMIVNLVWLSTIAVLPLLFGEATDSVITTGEGIWWWVAGFAALAAVVALLTVAREVTTTYVGYGCGFLSQRMVNRHMNALGSQLQRRTSAGEAVTVASVDPNTIAMSLSFGTRVVGALAIAVAVAGVLFSYSFLLGLVVLIGLALHMIVLYQVAKPLKRRIDRYRGEAGRLSEQMVDIVTGIRVLRSIGGEAGFNERFRGHSRRLRDRGYKTAWPQAIIEGLTVVIPAALGIAVLWIAVSMAIDGRMSAGDVVAVFGLSAFLLMPMENIAWAFARVPQAVTAAGRIADLLNIEPVERDGTEPLPRGDWTDPETALSLPEGRLTVVVGSLDRVSEAADRLCGYTGGDAAIGEVRVDDVDTDALRTGVLGLRNDHVLFTGPLRDNLDPHGRLDDGDLVRHLDTAAAQDAYDSLGGFDGVVSKDGRNLSGGQRQRLRLARALCADPDRLFAIEPTSALDSYTESLVVERVREARLGRTTVVMSSSPLWIEAADEIRYLPAAGPARSGTHAGLQLDVPEYAAAVSRS
ncbi:ABC transporter transmembrane domain-containing protein [Salininema proteolyticum]|uniref:ABC transporter transmembrane domain-containing protein n=1 Tax=Salininema proteolyticum TaxID=1607685 RepID=A0ABV8U0U3_9ACTN